jgi:tetratricopeptide (TPR) repeat protein
VTPADASQAAALGTWQRAEGLFKASRLDEAAALYEALVEGALGLPARLRLSVIASRRGDLQGATDHVLAAFRAGTREPELLESVAQRLLALGEAEAFAACADAIERGDCRSIPVLAGFGRMLVAANRPAQALVILRRARDLGLDVPATRYLEALSLLQCGELDAAEAGLEACIRAQPGFGRAHWALSKLRRQTPARNHVARLEALLGDGAAGVEELPALWFALFKELDDLDETGRAWEALQRGCAARRARVTFDAAAEAALFERLHAVCSGEFFDGPAGGTQGAPVPIFIVGLPRSGTTLLERVLGNHSAVADAGELGDLLWQLRWAANLPGPARLDLPLLERAAGVDYGVVGRRYLAHTRWRAAGRPFLTDKLPPNFLHVGFIRRALPQAKVLHLVRDPMDVCLSNLKELFAAAYYYSYDLDELAGHYGRYRRLMAHWHAQLPGFVLDVAYADLVTDPEGTTRRILDFCGLPWEPGCVAIENRTAPVTTASSTQVRESIHAGALGSWRRYAGPLEPLRQRLQDDGWLQGAV